METLKVLLQNNETHKTIRVRKLLKPVFVMFLLPWFFLLSSCVAIIPIGRPGVHGQPHHHDKHGVHGPHGPHNGHGSNPDEHHR